MNELLSQKINLRKILTHKRDLIKKNSTIEFNVKVFEKINQYINFKEILNIASFISIRSEISTHQLNKKIMDLGKTLSFPVIKRNSTELIFIKSYPSKNFKLGKFKGTCCFGGSKVNFLSMSSTLKEYLKSDLNFSTASIKLLK